MDRHQLTIDGVYSPKSVAKNIFTKTDGLVKSPSLTKRWLSKNFDIQGLARRHNAGDRTFCDAIKTAVLAKAAQHQPTWKLLWVGVEERKWDAV